MSVHTEQSVLISYALGCLDEEERARVAAHLGAGCVACRSALAEFESVAASLSLLLPHRRPSTERARYIKEQIRGSYPVASEQPVPRSHQPYGDLLALYALGCLDAREREAIETHLARGCAECRSALQAMEGVAGDLVGILEHVPPSEKVGRRLKERIRRSGGAVGRPEPKLAAVSDGAGAEGQGIAEYGRRMASPMVGRERELRLIERHLKALGKGDGRVVSIEAASGLGKSRLAAEAMDLKAMRGLCVWLGCSASMGHSASYESFVDLLTSWAGIPPGATNTERSVILEHAVSELLGREAGDVFPFLQRLMGLHVDPSDTSSGTAGIEGAALEKRIHESVRTLFARQLEKVPLVLVLEDLHWADHSTIRLLESLLSLVESHPLLVLTLSRPNHEQTSGRIFRFVDEHFRMRHFPIRLEGLSDRQAQVLSRNLLASDELPEPVANLVRSKAEGNPFYIEELIRSLVQAGAVERRQGRLVTTTELESIEIHGSLEQIIMSRVQRLDEPERQVLKTAAVIGQSFHRRVLGHMLGGRRDVDHSLELLEQAQFLRGVSSRATASVRVRNLDAESGYVFQHALTQEILYHSLEGAERCELHARCAEALEELFAERIQDFYGMLAYHYTCAQNLPKANEYLFKAGELAAASAASAEALHFFREAYRLYNLTHKKGDRETKARLERNIAMALLNTGNLSECIEHFNAALRLHGEWVPANAVTRKLKFAMDLPAVLLRLYTGSLGGSARGCGEKDRALFELMYNRSRAQNIVDDERRSFDNLAAIRHIGHLDPSRVRHAAGILAGAGAFFAFAGISFGPSHRFLALAERLAAEGDASDRFLYRTMAFVVCFLGGDWSAEHDIDEKLFEQGLRYGLLWDADVYLGMSCERNIHQGNYELALRQIARFSDLCEQWGYEFSRSNEYANTAYLLVAQRRLDEAYEATQRWHDLRNEDPLHVLALSLRAKVEALQGRLDEAQETLGRAHSVLSRARGLGFPYYSGAYLTSRLQLEVLRIERILAGRGVPRRSSRRAALNICRQAMANARKIARDRTETLRLGARLHWLLGGRSKAFRWWSEACTEAQRLGERAELARCYRDIGKLLGSQGGHKARVLAGQSFETYLAKAEELFTQLGSRRDLAELEKIKERLWRAA